SSLIKKKIVPMSRCSDKSRSIAASGQRLFCPVATSASRFPTHRLFSGFFISAKSTPAGVASEQRFSQLVRSLNSSAVMRARVDESRKFSSSLPSAEAQGGMHEARPVPPATYGYMTACTSSPAHLDATIVAMQDT